MAVDVGYVVAFGGGIVSFLSPCVLPLVPAYLSVVTGLDSGELTERGSKNAAHIAKFTGLFILGFGLVFVLLGLSASAVGRALTQYHQTITRISGGVLILLALFLLGSLMLRLPSLYGEARFHPNLDRFGPLAAPIAGVAFGFGWTPCIGPILGSVLTMAATQGRLAQGAILLTLYSLGLGIPFLIMGLAFGKLAGALGWMKKHFNALTILSSLALLGFGVLLLFNKFTLVTIDLQHLMQAIGLGRLVTLG